MSSGSARRTIIRIIFAMKPLMANPSIIAPICVEGIIPPREKFEVCASPEVTPIIMKKATPTPNANEGSKFSVINGNGIIKIALKRFVTLILKL